MGTGPADTGPAGTGPAGSWAFRLSPPHGRHPPPACAQRAAAGLTCCEEASLVAGRHCEDIGGVALIGAVLGDISLPLVLPDKHLGGG
jgi:hypothetical protein